MKKRIVITGLGVLAGNGKGKKEFFDALLAGRVGYRPISVFDTSVFPVSVGAEVPDFDAKAYLGQKGLRTLDRSTKLLVSASRLAIADSKLTITDKNTDDMGVSVGTTLGSVKSISDFDRVTLTEGPRYTNPAFFPNTVINSPASQVSIWNNIQGFNATLSTGFTASLDALRYAYDFLQMGRVSAVLAGGVEEMCEQTLSAFYALKFLSGSRRAGDAVINCPFDKRRNGIIFGEGACLIAMEEYGAARTRKAAIAADVLGFGYYFDPYRVNKYNPSGVGVRRAMKAALTDAGIATGDIDCICANANSTPEADRIETVAIKEVFGRRGKKIPVSAIKSMTGECFSVSGAFAVAAAVGMIERNCIFPTVNYAQPDLACDLDCVPNTSRPAKPKRILVNTFGPNGSHCCVIIGRHR